MLENKIHVCLHDNISIVCFRVSKHHAFHKVLVTKFKNILVQWSGQQCCSLHMQHKQHILGHGQVHFVHAGHNFLLLFLRLVRQTFKIVYFFFVYRVDAA